MAPHVIVYPTFRCGLSCPYCLDAHTKISVAKPGQAYKAIKNIKIGDNDEIKSKLGIDRKEIDNMFNSTDISETIDDTFPSDPIFVKE